jgi:hypothetical protein
MPTIPSFHFPTFIDAMKGKKINKCISSHAKSLLLSTIDRPAWRSPNRYQRIRARAHEPTNVWDTSASRARQVSCLIHVMLCFFDLPSAWMNPWMDEMVEGRWIIPCFLWLKWIDLIIWCPISSFLFMFFLGKVAKRIAPLDHHSGWIIRAIAKFYSICSYFKLSFSNIHRFSERKENK